MGSMEHVLRILVFAAAAIVLYGGLLRAGAPMEGAVLGGLGGAFFIEWLFMRILQRKQDKSS
ncbi:hypothetical protein [Alkalicoccus urumqiensis]|uniref:hypothetical protein n=1 Tax=Alkalicoccus urumqiensis TaxID=1548213 RepID=UPI0015E619E2|nr:hypothetical protein [Alkalicoccus urumqiensis]